MRSEIREEFAERSGLEDDGPIAGTAIECKRAAKADTEYSRVIGWHFCFRPYFGWRNSIPLAVSDRWHSCGDGGDDCLVIDALAERGEPPNQLLPKSCAIGRVRLDWDTPRLATSSWRAVSPSPLISTSDSCNQGSVWRKRTNIGRIVAAITAPNSPPL